MRRLTLLAVAGVMTAGAAAAPALAASTTSSINQSIPVSVTHDNGKICVTISEQVPQCVDTSPITDALPEEWHIGPVTVILSTANNGVFVGAGLAGQPLFGLSENAGEVCFGISSQVPLCETLVVG